MKTCLRRRWVVLAGVIFVLAANVQAQVPQLIGYQGRVAVGGTNFDGTGTFKFSLVNGAGTTTFWSNDGTGAGGSAPSNGVALIVSKGLYSVLLGDATLPNMTVIPSTVFTNGDVRLRVWFDDGAHGFERLDPDQRMAPVGYAMMAANAQSADTVKDNAITSAKIADGTISNADVAAGAAIDGTKIVAASTSARGTVQLATDGQSAGSLAVQANDGRLSNARAPTGAAGGDLTGTYPNPAISNAAVTAAKLADSAVTSAKILDGTVSNADVAANASIDGAKIVAASTAARGTVQLATDGQSQAGVAVQANDGRLSDSRAPTGVAGGDLDATYPNPDIRTGAVTTAKLADGAVTADKLGAAAVQADHLAPGVAASNLLAGGQSPVASGGVVLSASNTAPALLAAGYSRVGAVAVADAWTRLSTQGAPSPRSGMAGVWTGSKMLIWGGGDAGGGLNTGAIYDPATDTWTPMTTNGAPAARSVDLPVWVWSGTELLVWGGGGYFNTGGRYNPATDTWAPMTTNGAPAARNQFAAVWSGTELLVWGGFAGGTAYFNDGGRYNPVTDTWTTVAAAGAPTKRYGHSAVWTGSRMIVWGGWNGTTYPTDAAQYDPVSNAWTAVTTVGAPTARYYHRAVWSGTEMIVWGGGGSGGYVNTGGRYNPVSDTWTALSTSGAPGTRAHHTAVWSGTEMIVWGGLSGGGAYLNDGGRYNPVSGAWSAMTATSAEARRYHAGIWTGSEMVIFGGSTAGTYFNSPYSYGPPRTMWLYQRP